MSELESGRADYCPVPALTALLVKAGFSQSTAQAAAQVEPRALFWPSPPHVASAPKKPLKLTLRRLQALFVSHADGAGSSIAKSPTVQVR